MFSFLVSVLGEQVAERRIFFTVAVSDEFLFSCRVSRVIMDNLWSVYQESAATYSVCKFSNCEMFSRFFFYLSHHILF